MNRKNLYAKMHKYQKDAARSFSKPYNNYDNIKFDLESYQQNCDSSLSNIKGSITS